MALTWIEALPPQVVAETDHATFRLWDNSHSYRDNKSALAVTRKGFTGQATITYRSYDYSELEELAENLAVALDNYASSHGTIKP